MCGKITYNVLLDVSFESIILIKGIVSEECGVFNLLLSNNILK